MGQVPGMAGHGGVLPRRLLPGSDRSPDRAGSSQEPPVSHPPEEVVEIQERIAGLTPADEGTKAIVQESITEENLPKVRGMSFNELKDIIESPVTKDEPEYVDIFRGLAKKELERRRDEFESFKEDAETINTNKVIEVQRLMEKDGISSEYISPNFVAAFAARVGIELTSPEVVEITDTYNYEEEPEDLEKSRVQGAKDKQKRKKRAGIKFGDTVQVVGSSGDWRVLERDAVNSELVLIKQGHTGKMQRIHAGELIKKSVAGCETPEDLEKARTHGAKDKQKRKVKNLKEAIEVYGKNSLEAKKMKELKREKLTQLDDLEKSKKQSRRHVRTRAGKPYWAGQREETPVLEMEPESDIHEAERDTLKRYGIENPVRQGEPAYFCKSRQKPAGHKAYQRTTKTGKVAQIKEKPYAKKEKKSTKKQFDNFIYSQIFDKWDNDKINNITKKLKNTFPKKNKLIDKMIEIAGNASNIRDDFQQEEMEYSQEGTNAKEYNFLNKQLKNEYNQVEKISNQIFNKKK